MRKKGTMIVLVLLLVFQNLLFGMVGFANQENSTEFPEQDETIIEQPEQPEEGEGDNGLEDDESVIVPEDGDSTVTDEVYGPRTGQSGEAPVKLTDVRLYYLVEEGNPENDDSWIEYTEENEQSKNRLSQGENVRLVYDWKIGEGDGGYHEVKSGDTYEFDLPQEFKLHNDLIDEPLTYNSSSVGSFTVTRDNKVTMTFNENVENYSFVEGLIKIWSTIQIVEEKETIEFDIEFPTVGEGKIIPVKMKPEKGSAIEKSGTPDNSYNGTEFYWTVDINTSLDELDHVVLSDIIQNGQKLVDSSIKVYELNVALNGDKAQGKEITSGFENRSNELKVEIDFGSINSAYRVEFITIISDLNWEDEKVFKNEAELIFDGGNKTAEASVSIKRGKTLEKKSAHYDWETQTITWEIKYNYNQRSIPAGEAVLVDTLEIPDSLSLKIDSFNVVEMIIDENGNDTETDVSLEEGTDYSVVQSGNGFTLSFKNDINKPYKITYQTRIEGKVYEDFLEVVNRVVTGDGKNGKGEQTIRQGILIKSHDKENADYKNKKVEWTIRFNVNKYNMENVVLKDTFTNKGLELDPDTLTVQVEGGSELEKGSDYTLEQITPDSWKDGFKIEFKNDDATKEKEIVITYTTTFTYADLINGSKSFVNHVLLEWYEDGTKQPTKEAVSVFTPDKFTQNNGFKYGSYNPQTKIITWNIGINYNEDGIRQAVVEDFLQNNQQLDRNSIKVYQMELTGGENGVNKGEEITKGFRIVTTEDDPDLVDRDGNPGFRISFEDPIDSPYWISFQTSLKEEHVDEKYDNTAKLYNQDRLLTTLEASLSVKHGGEYVEKDGDQNEESPRFIDWKVLINPGQSFISTGAKIVDTPSSNQILLEETFEIYRTTVDDKGNLSKDEDRPPLEKGDDLDYILNIKEDNEGHQTFEIIFLNSFEEAYLLEYQSFLFNAKNGDPVSNKVEFSGGGIETGKKESTKEFNIKLSGGSGTGSGKVGSLTVIKIDRDSKETLTGAKFSLRYATNNRYIVEEIETDDKGRIVFEDLLFTDYILEELNAPKDYRIDQKEHLISLKNEDGNRDITVTITNTHKDTPGRIGDYVWKDSNRDGIQNEPDANGVNGVLVELYKVNDNGEYTKVDDQRTADKDGKSGYYLFDDLKEGYYKVCFHLPEGYAFTTPKAGIDHALDSDATSGAPPANDSSIGCSEEIFLPAGGEDLTIDAGLVLGRLGDYVWLDSNRNGIQDEPDLRGFDGVKVELYKKSDDKDDFEKIAETVTAKDENGKPGYYLFDDLLPGEYKVKFELPRGFAFTRKEVQNGKDGEISKAYYNGWTDEISLEAGEEDLTIDAGLVVLFGSDDDDDGDNGGSNPPPTTPPGKENPKDKDPKEKDPKDPNKGTPGDQTDGDDGFPANPPAPGTDSGDTGESGGTDGDNGEKTNNPPVQGETAPKDKGRTLPQTGENPSFLPLLGLFLCVAGAILWYRRKPQLN